MKRKIIIVISLAIFSIFFVYPTCVMAAQEMASDRIIVKFKPGSNIKTAAVKAKALQNMRRAYTVPVSAGEGLDEVLKAYGSRPDVEFVQPDYKRRAYNSTASTALPENWGVVRTGADKLSKEITGNDAAVVAVVDTGVDSFHPLLEGRVLPGYDFVNSDNDASDDSTTGHGTHVAGIIAKVAGEQPVRILPLKVLNSKGTGYDSAIADAIFYAVEHGADIINLSLGGEGYSPVLEEAVNYAVSNGVVVIAAAGNDSSDAGYYAPAGIESCVTVSAIDIDDMLAEFSNFGNVVDIAAPGTDIVSSVPLSVDHDGVRDGYTAFDGTSVAAPFVAGIGALLKVEDESLSGKQIEDLYYQNVDDVGYPGWDMFYGNGIIDFTDYIFDQSDWLENHYIGYKVLGTMRDDTPLDHRFTVKFSMAVDASSVTGDNILLYRYDTADRISVDIEAAGDDTFKMIPHVQLDKGREYWVVIEPTVKSRSGLLLNEGVVAKFETVE